MITGISLTNTSSFVLTGRNKRNSIFYIRPKEDFIKELKNKESGNKNLVISTIEGFEQESKIIEMIKSGKNFFTYFDGGFTEVKIVNNQLKSVRNSTKEDNIGKLPIIIDETNEKEIEFVHQKEFFKLL